MLMPGPSRCVTTPSMDEGVAPTAITPFQLEVAMLQTEIVHLLDSLDLDAAPDVPEALHRHLRRLMDAAGDTVTLEG